MNICWAQTVQFGYDVERCNELEEGEKKEIHYPPCCYQGGYISSLQDSYWTLKNIFSGSLYRPFVQALAVLPADLQGFDENALRYVVELFLARARVILTIGNIYIYVYVY